jgi:hypothetical protein
MPILLASYVNSLLKNSSLSHQTIETCYPMELRALLRRDEGLKNEMEDWFQYILISLMSWQSLLGLI